MVGRRPVLSVVDERQGDVQQLDVAPLRLAHAACVGLVGSDAEPRHEQSLGLSDHGPALHRLAQADGLLAGGPRGVPRVAGRDIAVVGGAMPVLSRVLPVLAGGALVVAKGVRPVSCRRVDIAARHEPVGKAPVGIVVLRAAAPVPRGRRDVPADGALPPFQSCPVTLMRNTVAGVGQRCQSACAGGTRLARSSSRWRCALLTRQLKHRSRVARTRSGATARCHPPRLLLQVPAFGVTYGGTGRPRRRCPDRADGRGGTDRRSGWPRPRWPGRHRGVGHRVGPPHAAAAAIGPARPRRLRRTRRRPDRCARTPTSSSTRARRLAGAGRPRSPAGRTSSAGLNPHPTLHRPG